MTYGFVLWGTMEEHLQNQQNIAWPIIRVVTNYLQRGMASRQEFSCVYAEDEVWIGENALQQWTYGDICWPSAKMVAASGDVDQIADIAQWYAAKLRTMGITGVFGLPQGILSHLNLPWMGDAICEEASKGFYREGLRIAVPIEEGRNGTKWRLEGGDVLPLSLRGTLKAPWYWASVDGFASLSDALESFPVPHQDRVRDAINHMRTQSIHLVDDPGVLPYSDCCKFVVKSSNWEIKSAIQQYLDTVQDSQGSVVSMWLDEIPSEAGAEGIVVAYQNPGIISQAPKNLVKVQIFDNHPAVWEALREKLLGRVGWFGRTPERLDRAGPTTHATHYSTEQPHPDTRLRWLEFLPLQHSMQRWITSEQQALDRIRPMISTLERIVVEMTERYRAGARIFYVGAGSAGRAGVMDAVELPPTFGTDPSRVQAILAGGLGAFMKAREGEEDSFFEGQASIASVNAQTGDVVLGITAHGDTPFVLGALSEAKKRGCYTVTLVNNLGTRSASIAEEVVFIDSGPEILLGSTRLKAGTVEKVILNMISTLIMVKLGRSYDNLMIDFTATNDKLRERAVRVFMIATGEPRNHALAMLHRAHGSLPVALVMQMCQMSEDGAKGLLATKTVSELLDSKKRARKAIHGSRA